MALRETQPRRAIETHFKKSRLFWYLLNRRLFNSFKSWDFFCIDRIKNLSALSNKAYNLCSKLLLYVHRDFKLAGMGHLQLFYKFTKVRSFYNNISSFLHEKVLSFSCIFASGFSLNQTIFLYVVPHDSFCETQYRSESFKLVNQISRTVWGGRDSNSGTWQLLLHLRLAFWLPILNEINEKVSKKLSKIINFVKWQRLDDVHCKMIQSSFWSHYRCMTNQSK